MAFRFEKYENVVTKHHLGSSVNWTQAARWAFMNGASDKDVHIKRVRMVGPDTVEIIKHRDQNKSMCFKYFGGDQEGLYERVIINRKDQTVAVDRIDANWAHDEPFMGQRDLFYPETRPGSNEQLAFVRHAFWLFKLNKFGHQLWSNFSAMSYKRSFASTASSL